MTARRNGDKAALSLFSDLLRDARHKVGLSSDDLGAKLGIFGGADPLGSRAGTVCRRRIWPGGRTSNSATRASARRWRNGCATCRSR